MADPVSFWTAALERSLGAYHDELLKRVATRLVRPRSPWSNEELIERIRTTLDNPAVVDRRLQDLETPSRQLLALIGHSRQPIWEIGNLVEFTVALEHADGLKPVLDLLEAGLLFPTFGADPAAPGDERRLPAVVSFESWLGFPGLGGLAVFSPPLVTARAIGEPLGLPDLTSWKPPALLAAQAIDGEGEEEEEPEVANPEPTPSLLPRAPTSEADGLEWPLRLAVIWQQVATQPLRRTQGGGFFKRDNERLSQDPLLTGAPAESFADVPDLGFFIVTLAERLGVVQSAEGELRLGALPTAWDDSLGATLQGLFVELTRLKGWNPLDGWQGSDIPPGNPFPSAYLLSLLVLAQLPDGAFIEPAKVEAWLLHQHPYWNNESTRPSRRQPWVERFLLGIAYHLRLVALTRGADGTRRVRLSTIGRWLLGLSETSPTETGFAKTLLVQPNLEILAYRQGLNTALLAKLTRCAAWKSLGAACTLQLEPETVYRALEAGESFESIRRTLEQHGTRPIPSAVLDSLRTWSDKRDRITVYPSATLLEFATPEDLNEAFSRGLEGVRISDRLAVATSEQSIDFRQFRLTGTRDYAVPPERCVSIESDGVTLTVDVSRSDLLLETELPRFAEALGKSTGETRRQYRLTPASLAAARESGMNETLLENWFLQRIGAPLSPAARLLLGGAVGDKPRLQRHLVLHVAEEETADGLMQWPETRALFAGRLGPTALEIEDINVPELREKLRTIGIALPE